LAHRAGSRAGQVGLIVLRAIAGSLNDDRTPVMHQPAEQGPGRSAVSRRDGRPSNEAAISWRTREARRHDSKRPNRTTSAPPSSISRWSNFTGAKHGYKNAYHNHNSRRRAHKGGAPECRGIRSAPGQLLPSDDGSTTGAPEMALRVETTYRTCASPGSRAGTRQRSRRTFSNSAGTRR
jgi:hypothetical protein